MKITINWTWKMDRQNRGIRPGEHPVVPSQGGHLISPHPSMCPHKSGWVSDSYTFSWAPCSWAVSSELP